MKTGCQQQIKEALLRGDINWQQALEAVTADKRKPWQTKEWHQKRDELLKANCEQCGSPEPPLVLHHLVQPRKFEQIKSILYIFMYDEYRQQHPISYSEPEPVNRPACPKCLSTAIYPRKNGEYKWKCNGKSGIRICGHQFNEPAIVQALTPEQKRVRSQETRLLYEQLRAEFREKYFDVIATEAVLISIDEHSRYMSCVDTRTFCKKCAFLWDKQNLMLCLVSS